MQFVEPIIGAVAAFALGFAWYTAIFGKAWQAETGLSDEDAQKDMARTHGLAFLMMVVMSFALNFYFNFHPEEEHTFLHGGFHGILAGLFYGAPVVAINYLYQRKSLKLFLIDAGYVIAFLGLSGGVMAALNIG